MGCSKPNQLRQNDINAIFRGLRQWSALARLRRRFPHTLSLHFDPEGASPATSPVARASARSDHEVVLAGEVHAGDRLQMPTPQQRMRPKRRQLGTG